MSRYRTTGYACGVCGAVFAAARGIRARYCSARCRQSAYRTRRARAEPELEDDPPAPAPERGPRFTQGGIIWTG